MAGSTQDQLLLMAQMTSEEAKGGSGLAAQKYLPIALFLVTSLVISILGVIYTRNWEVRLDYALADTLLGATESELVLRLDRLVTDARIISGFVLSSNHVDNDEFLTFTQALLDDNPTTEYCFLLNYKGQDYATSADNGMAEMLMKLKSISESSSANRALVSVDATDFLAVIQNIESDEHTQSRVVTLSRLSSFASAPGGRYSENSIGFQDSFGQQRDIGIVSDDAHSTATLTHGDLSIDLHVNQKVVESAIFSRFRWAIMIVCVIASTLFIFQFIQARRSIRDFIDLTMERSQELSSINSDLVDEIMGRARLQAELLEKNHELSDTNLQLEDARQQLVQREKLASLGQLSAGIAHEINNPVAFVKSNVSMMKKYWDRASQYIDQSSALVADKQELKDALDGLRSDTRIQPVINNFSVVIEESLDGLARVQQIVQDLKMFSRSEESEFQRADVNDCLDSALNILRSQITPAVTIHKQYGDIPQPEMMASQVHQVMVNLISNALHAIGESGNIYLTTHERDESVFIAIEDDGEGIDPEVLGRIFDPFFTTKETGKGTGLGLSLSYGIIERHRGEISVESEQGKGTCFTIRIPVTQKLTEQNDV